MLCWLPSKHDKIRSQIIEIVIALYMNLIYSYSPELIAISSRKLYKLRTALQNQQTGVRAGSHKRRPHISKCLRDGRTDR